MVTKEDILELEFELVSQSGDFIDFTKNLNNRLLDLSLNVSDNTIMIMSDYRILYHGKPDSKQSLLRIINNL